MLVSQLWFIATDSSLASLVFASFMRLHQINIKLKQTGFGHLVFINVADQISISFNRENEPLYFVC